MIQNNNETTQATVKGYSLCIDIEDKELRLHNRANVMANIFEDNMVSNNASSTSGRGLYIITQYMEALPIEERGPSIVKFQEVMAKRGYKASE